MPTERWRSSDYAHRNLRASLAPSVNGMFANTGQGRVKTKGYREWRKTASAAIIAQRVPAFTGTFRLEVRASDQGLIHARDIDNLAKATADAFVHCGILAADDYRHLRAIGLAWAPDLPAGTCCVSIEELSAEPLPKPATKPRRAAKRAEAKRAAVTPAIMRALRAKGIHVSPERVRL
jgi:hypothetical protein